MEKFAGLMVRTITTFVRVAFVFESSTRYLEFRVDWNELYHADHYKRQEKIYEDRRPTLLSHTLVVPMQKIREHIQDLTEHSYARLRDQIERLYQANKRTTDDRSPELKPMDTLNHLQTYTIEVNREIFSSFLIHRFSDQTNHQ